MTQSSMVRSRAGRVGSVDAFTNGKKITASQISCRARAPQHGFCENSPRFFCVVEGLTVGSDGKAGYDAHALTARSKSEDTTMK